MDLHLYFCKFHGWPRRFIENVGHAEKFGQMVTVVSIVTTYAIQPTSLIVLLAFYHFLFAFFCFSFQMHYSRVSSSHLHAGVDWVFKDDTICF